MHPDIFFTIDKNTGSNYSVSAFVPFFATNKILIKIHDCFGHGL